MFVLTSYAKLITKNRKSKARYVEGLEINDIVRFSIDFKRTQKSYGRGNYAFAIEVHKYLGSDPHKDYSYQLIGSSTQNEIFNGFNAVGREIEIWDQEPVFNIAEIPFENLVEIYENDENRELSPAEQTIEKMWNAMDDHQAAMHPEVFEEFRKILANETAGSETSINEN